MSAMASMRTCSLCSSRVTHTTYQVIRKGENYIDKEMDRWREISTCLPCTSRALIKVDLCQGYGECAGLFGML